VPKRPWGFDETVGLHYFAIEFKHTENAKRFGPKIEEIV